jgi:hypothetical protein
VPARFDWFTAWVHQHVGAALGFGRGLDVDAVVARLGLADRDHAMATWDETVRSGVPAVRVGTLDRGWGWAVGHLTLRSADEVAIANLSTGGGASFALVFTDTVSTFTCAEDGTMVSGVDLTVPNLRFGPEPDRFAREVASVLSEDGGLGDVPGRGARLVELAMGVTLDRRLVDGPAFTFRV